MTAVEDGLSEAERAFLTALARVESQFPEFVGKFTVCRAHQHFPVLSGEVLYERTDTTSRQSVTSPIRQTLIPQDSFPTEWKLSRAHGQHYFEVIKKCCGDRT